MHERVIPQPNGALTRRPTEIVVDWQDDTIVIDVIGRVDRSSAAKVLSIIAAVDRAVGMRDVIVRLDPHATISSAALDSLRSAGLQPQEGPGEVIVLRPIAVSAR
ncbi:MAG: hypothetical protein AB7O92_01860 [Acidimicrobiia bacterium]